VYLYLWKMYSMLELIAVLSLISVFIQTYLLYKNLTKEQPVLIKKKTQGATENNKVNIFRSLTRTQGIESRRIDK